MIEARYYNIKDGIAACQLCPHNCKLSEGQMGICRVRKNNAGKLISENYGKVCALHTDPIEKKPFYHFFPGANILSVGSIGCNLHCKFCQNWEISQSGSKEFTPLKTTEADDIISMALQQADNIGIAYTYNEPTVWIEFMLDVARIIKEKQMKNVMVTNGFINPGPLDHLLQYIDAFSVDLKAFTDDFYKTLTSSALAPVLKTLKTISKSDAHLEITNLVIPNRNDDPSDFMRMIDWIADEIGTGTVLHISRYFPTYKMDEPPTPEKKLLEFFRLARKKLDHVYLGNLRSGEHQNTFCPSCSTLSISRSGYFTEVVGLDHDGRCLNCNETVIPPRNMHF
jgi:pyruvate formate lyase activating enzyme